MGSSNTKEAQDRLFNGVEMGLPLQVIEDLIDNYKKALKEDDDKNNLLKDFKLSNLKDDRKKSVIADSRKEHEFRPDNSLPQNPVPPTPGNNLLMTSCYGAAFAKTPQAFRDYKNFIEKYITEFDVNEQNENDGSTALHLLFTDPNLIDANQKIIALYEGEEKLKNTRYDPDYFSFRHNKIIPRDLVPSPNLERNDPTCSLVELLLMEGANPSLQKREKAIFASEKEEKENEVFKTNPNSAHRYRPLETKTNALMLAILCGYENAVKEIVARHPRCVSEVDENGMNALGYACRQGNVNGIVAPVLAVSSKEDRARRCTQTCDHLVDALHGAVAFGSSELVEFLLKNGLDFAFDAEYYAMLSAAASLLPNNDTNAARLQSLFPRLDANAIPLLRQNKQAPPVTFLHYVGRAFSSREYSVASAEMTSFPQNVTTTAERNLLADAVLVGSPGLFDFLVSLKPHLLTLPILPNPPFVNQETVLHLIASFDQDDDSNDNVARYLNSISRAMPNQNLDEWFSSPTTALKNVRNQTPWDYAVSPVAQKLFPGFVLQNPKNYDAQGNVITASGYESPSTFDDEQHQRTLQRIEDRFVSVSTKNSYAFFIEKSSRALPKVQFISNPPNIQTDQERQSVKPGSLYIDGAMMREILASLKQKNEKASSSNPSLLLNHILLRHCWNVKDEDLELLLDPSLCPTLRRVELISCRTIEWQDQSAANKICLKMAKELSPAKQVKILYKDDRESRQQMNNANASLGDIWKNFFGRSNNPFSQLAGNSAMNQLASMLNNVNGQQVNHMFQNSLNAFANAGVRVNTTNMNVNFTTNTSTSTTTNVGGGGGGASNVTFSTGGGRRMNRRHRGNHSSRVEVLGDDEYD